MNFSNKMLKTQANSVISKYFNVLLLQRNMNENI